MGGRILVESERRGVVVVVVVVVAAFRRRAAAEAAEAEAASTAPSTASADECIRCRSADASDADQQMQQADADAAASSKEASQLLAGCVPLPLGAWSDTSEGAVRPVRAHARTDQPAFRSTKENVCPTVVGLVAACGRLYACAGPKRGFFDDEGGREGAGGRARRGEARRGELS
jgi:hypothetical protein